MALIKCPECGKEISDISEKCINCGFPLEQAEEDFSIEWIEPKNEMSTARLIIGIVMLVFSIPVLFQSCAAGIFNSIKNNGGMDGTIGLLVSWGMIVFGIIAIATWRTTSHNFLAVMSVLSCLIFIYCSFIYDGIFGDLVIWGCLFAVYSIFFGIASSAVKQNNKPFTIEEDRSGRIKP